MPTKRFRISPALFLLPLVLFALPSVGGTPKELTRSQAIRAAEQFIVLNGYTDLPPTKDLKRLSYESIWFSRADLSESENIQNMVESRHNSLERTAYAYGKYRRDKKQGWTVVFRYERSYSPRRDRGRAVTMAPDGRGMRIEHSDAILKAFTKIKRDGARTGPGDGSPRNN